MAARARRERAMEMLERVGLGPRAGHLPTQLSGWAKVLRAMRGGRGVRELAYGLEPVRG